MDVRNFFVKPSDPILIKRAREIPVEEIASEDVQKTIDWMLQLARGNQENPTKAVLVGLAAPQVGISRRIILVDIGANGKGQVSDLAFILILKSSGLPQKKKSGMKAVFRQQAFLALFPVRARSVSKLGQEMDRR